MAQIYLKRSYSIFKKTAIAHASNLEIAEALIAAGDDINQIDAKVRAALLNIGFLEKVSLSKEKYLEQKHRTFGKANPQKCEISFWYDMVRCNFSAWHARRQFDDEDSLNDRPVWCYERFGKSVTAIGNGEFIEIGGEHEDSYDPDFCIYNEIFHHKGGSELIIYQYPEHVFPPTDFHSAILVDKFIYIIGNLGYPAERVHGTTPVYRLDINTFEISKVETRGEHPGWIYKHSAYLKHQSIRIQSGEILEKSGGIETHSFNKFDYELNLNTFKWTKHQHVPKSGIAPFFLRNTNDSISQTKRLWLLKMEMNGDY